jgi:DNA-binding FrmR family transcriptional regulator
MKCNDKKCKYKSCDCKDSLNHLSRIEGQIRTLKKYIEEGQKCEKVASLTTSIAKSFDSLRAKTLKNFFINDILGEKKISKKDLERIEKIFKMYKK